MQMQQGCSVGEHGVDVDLLDVGEVGHGVLAHLELTLVHDGTIVSVDSHELGDYVVESVSSLPYFFKCFVKLCSNKYRQSWPQKYADAEQAASPKKSFTLWTRHFVSHDQINRLSFLGGFYSFTWWTAGFKQQCTT